MVKSTVGGKRDWSSAVRKAVTVYQLWFLDRYGESNVATVFDEFDSVEEALTCAREH